jgi:hypothetical protein
MLDKDICELLEIRISEVLRKSSSEYLNAFWCDGVMLPLVEQYYSIKFVNDNRRVSMTAFLGKSGQDKYELNLFFGDKALSKYARGLDISPCVPNFESQERFKIDTEKKQISIELY